VKIEISPFFKTLEVTHF